MDLLEQLHPLHAGHDLVGDDHGDLFAVVLEVFDQIQRLARVLGDRDVALAAEARRQLLAQRREDSLLVIDADDVLAQGGDGPDHPRSLEAGPGEDEELAGGPPGDDQDGHEPTRASFTATGAGGGPSIGSRTSNRVQPWRLSTR